VIIDEVVLSLFTGKEVGKKHYSEEKRDFVLILVVRNL
jgi:hypothetical protein